MKRKGLLLATLACLATACFVGCGQSSGGVPAGTPVLKDGEVYVYDEKGERVEQDETFVQIGENVYYVIENVPVKDGYKVIDNRVYYFDENGVRGNDGSESGHEFSDDGYMTGEFVELNIDGEDYFIVDDTAYIGKEVSGIVYESDSDYITDNNILLTSVVCKATVAGHTFTAMTDENGAFLFEGKLPTTTVVFTFELDGYFMATATVDCSQDGLITIVLDRSVSNTLTGRIVAADDDVNISNNAPLSDANITLTRTSSTNVWNYETTSDASGYYTFEGLTAGIYTLTVEKEGCLPISQIVQVRHNETTIQNFTLEIIPQVEDESGDVVVNGFASGTIKDARTGYVISVGLTVYIREGINNILGEPICSVKTDANGVFTTPELPAGNYTAYVVDERTTEELPNGNEDCRYGSQTIALKILPNKTISGQDATISNNEGVSGSGVRVVLTWGSTPSDLDSHLLINDGAGHVYYSNKSYGNCTLDVDDRDGNGPETITIKEVQANKYEYYVYNFSKSGTFYNANATVKVYFGLQLAYTFNAPQGSGYYWHLFTITSTGDFIVHNTTADSAM